MSYNFDSIIDRRSSDSAKWRRYSDDVLPLWVADMDFPSPDPVIQALQRRVDHGVFGYGLEPPELRPVIVERLSRLYGWHVEPDQVVFLPGVVVGFNLATQAVTSPGDGVLVQTPVYYPILDAPDHARCTLDAMELTSQENGSYAVDMDAFETAVTPRTRIFILCNPHNPVGRVFGRVELEQMAEICLRHDLVICSDEIHSDLIFGGTQHLPIASLDPEIAQRTITLMAPTKTFNIAGLHFSFAIVQNPDLRRRLLKARSGLVPWGPGLLACTAALAAYREGQPWLDALLCYLEANRDFLLRFVTDNLPGITMSEPEGTYLAWLDCQQSGISRNPHDFFLESARVALNDGAAFGSGGQGYVRLNFGCPRPILTEALQRMKQSMLALQKPDTGA